jgi:hypothetical protein
MALTLLALARAGTPELPPANEVTVVGQRLKHWRGKVSTTIGITTCRTEVSTGDKEIDAIGCGALKGCWGEYRPAYAAAIKAKQRNEAERIEHMLGQCLKTRRDALVAEFVERRAAAKAVS